jgi:type IV pilus assembly protein PilC
VSTFAFRAIDVAGIPSRGEIDAESKAQVSEQLRQRGLIVLDVSEKAEAFRFERLLDRFRGIRMREMAVFARQFATLVASGMPMLRSLYTLEDQTEDERLAAAITSVRHDVEAGSSLADAMERRPTVFDPLFRAMVRSGEGSGRLEEALERVAFHLEKMDALRRQIRSAMLYPSFVFTLAVLVTLAVVAFIVPIFAGIYEEIAAETPGESAQLPLLTRITMSVSDAVTGYWFVWIPLTVAAIVVFFQWN